MIWILLIIAILLAAGGIAAWKLVPPKLAEKKATAASRTRGETAVTVRSEGGRFTITRHDLVSTIDGSGERADRFDPALADGDAEGARVAAESFINGTFDKVDVKGFAPEKRTYDTPDAELPDEIAALATQVLGAQRDALMVFDWQRRYGSASRFITWTPLSDYGVPLPLSVDFSFGKRTEYYEDEDGRERHRDVPSITGWTVTFGDVKLEQGLPEAQAIARGALDQLARVRAEWDEAQRVARVYARDASLSTAVADMAGHLGAPSRASQLDADFALMQKAGQEGTQTAAPQPMPAEG